jgi:hypothetical protein
VNDAESNAATPESNSVRQGKRVRGSPIIGNALDKARDPARFFLRYYREHGPPCFRIKPFNATFTVLAGSKRDRP